MHFMRVFHALFLVSIRRFADVFHLTYSQSQVLNLFLNFRIVLSQNSEEKEMFILC